MDIAVSLYLDLMKKTLSFYLWPEPPKKVTVADAFDGTEWHEMMPKIAGELERKGLEIMRSSTVTTSQVENGEIWPEYADTMIGLRRLDNIQYCVQTIIDEDIEGDLIETGVWRGGAVILMQAILVANRNIKRRLFVADSFQGLPKPDTEKWPVDAGDAHFKEEFLAVSKEQVEHNFRKYGLLHSNVVFLEGFFEDTLPQAPIDKLAILRLDGDMYGSTMEALNHLYPKLQRGGFCIVDDYALRGCKAAVDDYRTQHGIDAELMEVDWTGRYWRKQ